MKKLLLSVCLFLAVSFSAVAEEYNMGLGYDGGLNMVMLRHKLGENALDIGLGFDFDKAQTEKFAFGAAGFYLMPVKNFIASFIADEKFNVFCYAGGIVDYDRKPKFNIAVAGGLQPEYYLHPRVAVETRFGVNMHLLDGFYFRTFGNQLSITSGLAFKVFF